MADQEQIKQQWEEIKNKVRQEYEVSDISYKTWIQPLEFGGLKGDTVYIQLPSNQGTHLDYIKGKFSLYFQVVISEMMGEDFEVFFLLKEDAAKEDSFSGSHTEKQSVSPGAAAGNLNPKYKFETFIVGNNNNVAHAASLAVAETPGEVYNPLYIYGGPGLGKTHLMHSIGHYILERNPRMKVLYVTSENFTNDVIESVRKGQGGNAVDTSMRDLREKYRTVDVLMIDDIQFIIGKAATQEEFFHTFNALREARKQIVISSDRPPKEIDTLDDRFRSRFSWGMIVDIQSPDYETRMAILQKNAEELHAQIGNDIIEYIASNIVSNVRELEGALNKVSAYAKLKNKGEYTLEIAQEALKDVILSSKASGMSFENILKVVCETYHVSENDILSSKRNSEYVTPRQVIMYLCSEVARMTQSDIARKLGRDHSTIIHGIKNIKTQITEDSSLAQKIDLLSKKIES